MSDSLIQSDLSELVIGLSSEHSYREITPTHTHTRAQFYMPLLELFRFYAQSCVDCATHVRVMDSSTCRAQRDFTESC